MTATSSATLASTTVNGQLLAGNTIATGTLAVTGTSTLATTTITDLTVSGNSNFATTSATNVTLNNSAPGTTTNMLYNLGGSLYWSGSPLGIAGAGLQSLNGLSSSTQSFATSTAGNDFTITSSGSIHTFNLPDAGLTSRGLVSTTTQIFAGDKTFVGTTTMATTTIADLTATNLHLNSMTLPSMVVGTLSATSSATLASTTAYGQFLAGNVVSTGTVVAVGGVSGASSTFTGTTTTGGLFSSFSQIISEVVGNLVASIITGYNATIGTLTATSSATLASTTVNGQLLAGNTIATGTLVVTGTSTLATTTVTDLTANNLNIQSLTVPSLTAGTFTGTSSATIASTTAYGQFLAGNIVSTGTIAAVGGVSGASSTFTGTTTTGGLFSSFSQIISEVVGNLVASIITGYNATIGTLTATSSATLASTTVNGQLLAGNTIATGTLSVTGTSTLATTTITDLTANNLHLSSLTVPQLTAGTLIATSSATLATTTVTGITATYATSTNATSTNLYTTTMVSGLSTTTQLNANTATIGTENVGSATFGSAIFGSTTVTGTSTTNGLFASFAQIVTDVVGTLTASIANITNATIATLTGYNGTFGALTASSSLVSSGNTTLATTTVNGGSTFNKSATFNQGLSVVGTSTLAGVLDMSSNRIVNLATPTGTNDATNKAYVDAIAQGVSWKSPVIDFASTTMPGSPVNGDRYIVSTTTTATGTGCQIDQIAQYNGTTWDCTATSTGLTVYVNTLTTSYNWNGTSWISLGSTVNHGSLSGLQGGNTGEYYHLNLSDYSALHNPNAQLSALQIIGAPSFAGLSVTGSSTLANALSVVGTTTITGGTGITGALSVSATSSLNGMSANFANIVNGVVATLNSTAATIAGLTGYTGTFGTLNATSSLNVTGTSTMATTTIADLTANNLHINSLTVPQLTAGTISGTSSATIASTTAYGQFLAGSIVSTGTVAAVGGVSGASSTFTGTTTTGGLFSSFAQIVTGVINTLTATVANITTATIATLTGYNATLGTLTATSSATLASTTVNGQLLAGNTIATGTLAVLGTSTLATTTVTDLTANNLHIQSLTVPTLTAGTLTATSSATLATTTVTGITATYSTATNATSTNIYSAVANFLTALVSNITGYVGTFGSLTATSSATLASTTVNGQLLAGNTIATGTLDVTGTTTLATTTATGLTISQNGLTLASSTPTTTANTLYSLGNTLYWNGAVVGGSLSGGTSNYLSYWTSNSTLGTSTLYFASTTGGVGIGTTTDAYGNALANGLSLGFTTNAGNNIANVIVLSSATSTANVSTSSNALYVVNGTLYFNGSQVGTGVTASTTGWTTNSTTSNLTYLSTTAGSVLIGSTSTSTAAKLEVYASSTDTSLSVKNLGSGLAAAFTGAISRVFGTTFSTSTALANNVNFGNTSRVRVQATTTSFVGITGIVAGVDGQDLSMTNVGPNSFLLYDQSILSTSTNRIITGVSGNLTVNANTTVQLVYDSSVSAWRVVSGGATSATSTSAYFPTLYNEQAYGPEGLVFIYRGQIYTTGHVGVRSTGFENTANGYTPNVLPVAGTPPTGWSQIAANVASACAISNAGTVYCWGLNSNYQLGQNDTTNRFEATPVTIPNGGAAITQIITNSAGTYPTYESYEAYFAIDANGKVWAWGYNSAQGSLGTGSTATTINTPTQVGSAIWSTKKITKVVISSNDGNAAHAAAIDSTGQLYTWGYNNVGQLGQGAAGGTYNTPTLVSGMTNVVDVAVGGAYNGSVWTNSSILAVKADGSVWGAGGNASGQLGTSGQQNSFVQTAAPGSNAIRVYMSGGSSYYLTSDGQVRSAGWNNDYQLGTGDNINRAAWIAPTNTGFQGKVTKIVPFGNTQYGWSGAYILDSDGNVWSVGQNGRGQLGQPSTVSAQTTFAKVYRNTDGTRVRDIRATGRYDGSTVLQGAVIVLDDGTMMYAGDNTYGQSGANPGNTSLIYTFKYVNGFAPGDKVSSSNPGTSVSLSSIIGAALGNTIDNLGFGQLWNWSAVASNTAMTYEADNLTSGSLISAVSSSSVLTGNIMQILATGNSASSTGNALYLNVSGTNSSTTALKITQSGSGLAMDIAGAISLRAGYTFSTSGTTDDANFGNTSLVRVNVSLPAIINGIIGGSDGKIITVMNVGSATTTFNNQASTSQAVNRIITGQGAPLSIGPDQSITMQYDAASGGTTGRWRVISGGSGSGATIIQTLATSSVYALPVLMTADDSDYQKNGVAWIYKNQIYTMGNAYAYGLIDGVGNATNYSPAVVPISGTAPTGWSKIVGTRLSACALSNVGTVYCWGYNGYGQLGDNSTTNRYTAVPVDFSAVSVTYPIKDIVTVSNQWYAYDWATFYAIDNAGKVFAWGNNTTGQIGDGTTNQANRPKLVGSGSLNGKQIVKISVSGDNGTCAGCGSAQPRVTVAAIDSTGQLYMWGNGYTQSPAPVSGMTNVIDVVSRGESDDADGTGAGGGTDRYFTVAVKNDGTVWSTGYNANGLFGNTTVANNTSTSTFVQATSLAGVTISKIYASEGNGGYVAAVSNTGTIYFAGYGSDGNFGATTATTYNSYTLPIDTGFQGKVKKVILYGSAPYGASGTMILTTDGDLYAAGWQDNGHLGVGGNSTGSQMNTFTRVLRNTDGYRVIDMVPYGPQDGAHRTDTMIELENGTLMTAGYGGYGMLGSDVSATANEWAFKYVIGWGPSNTQSIMSSGLVPMNLVAGANAGGVLDNGLFSQTWNWSTASTTNGMLNLVANNLTTGTLETITSSNDAFAGNLLKIEASGAATSTASLAYISVSTTTSNATGLKVVNLGNGLAADFTGAVAFRRGDNYVGSGVQDNLVVGNSSVIRLTGATNLLPLNINGIAGGTDGRILNLMNVGTGTTTLGNMASAVAANSIVTGTGSSVSFGAGASIQLIYDGFSNVWRVIGGVGGSFGGTATVATSSQYYLPVLMNNENSSGQLGAAFIYRGQIYTMGPGGTAGYIYGVGGDASGPNALVPTVVSVATSSGTVTFSQLVGAPRSMCAISTSGYVFCGGYNSVGQLGQGDTSDRYYMAPVNIPNGGVAITKIYTTSERSSTQSAEVYYAIDGNGKVWAWGTNGWGNIGSNLAANPQPTPIQVGTGNATFLSRTIVKLAVSGADGVSVAALDSTGQLWSWGHNSSGQLGIGNLVNQSVPQPVTGMTSGVADVKMIGQWDGGTARTDMIILKTNGQVWCAGQNTYGECGVSGDTSQHQTPVQSTSLGSAVITQIYGAGSFAGADGSFVAVVDNAGQVYTVGNNGYGVLGLGDTTNRSAYTMPAGSFQGKVVKLAVAGSSRDNGDSIYILDSNGDVWAAGQNANGSLGIGNASVSNTFKKVVRNSNGAKVVDVHAWGNPNTYGNGALLVLEDGTLMVSGNGSYGATGQANAAGYDSVFKFVIGFAPGDKLPVSGSSGSAFSQLSGASLGNVLDNLNFSQTWNWSSASTTTGLLSLNANALTTGNLLQVGSSASNFTGDLAQINLSGASSTGNALAINVSGASSTADAIQISNLGQGLALNIGGSVAFQHGTDYTSPSQSDNAPLANASLVRLNTSGAAQLITGISGGMDGKILTLMNVANATATLANNSGSSLAANRIITGLGANLQIGPSQSVQLMYDGAIGAQVWRVISGAAGGGTTYVTQTLATSSVSYIPQLMDANDQYGMRGQIFIYKNQLWGMGQGWQQYTPYGQGLNTDRNYAPQIIPIAATTSAPNGPSGWSMVVGSSDNACALSNVGTVYCMGYNNIGQTGTNDAGTHHYTMTPITFPNNAFITKLYVNSTATTYDANSTYFAIDSLGRLYAWGRGTEGQIGDGAGVNRTYPVQVTAGGITAKQIVKVSVSNNVWETVMALASDGTLYGWGHNTRGELGINNASVQLAPVVATTSVADMVVRGGYDDPDAGGGATGRQTQSSLILKTDGTVWGAGFNSVGTLGNGLTAETHVFVKATGLSNITKIFMGEAGTGGSGSGETVAAAVDNSGNVYFSGYNPYGGLGMNNTNNYNTFTAPTGGDTSFQGKVAKVVFAGNVFASNGSTYILTTDGQLYAAGRNNQGQLGVGDSSDHYTFSKVIRNSNGAKVVDVHAYGFASNEGGAYITLDDGTMMSTGYNGQGAGGTDVQTYGNNYSFRYVLGFAPGQNANQYSGSLVPLNLFTGANLGNTLDNLNFTQEWDWSTASTSQALLLTANSLTSGTLETLTTASPTFTGSLLSLVSSANSASSTGTVANISVTGANNAATALRVSNVGTGLAVDVTGGLAMRLGMEYTGVNTTNNAPLGNGSLVRLNGGGTSQILTGIAGGTDGKLLTLMNANTATATLRNLNGGSLLANQIITGTGADLQIAPSASVMLQYDVTASKWRVVGGAGGSGGTTIVQTLSTSSASYIPTLMKAESQMGMQGMAFIYRNQIYTFGYGTTDKPYGIGGGANSNTGLNAGTPSLLAVLGTTTAPNGPSGWSEIAGTMDSACALSNVGTVYCWGDNSQGQLGTADNPTDHYAATMVPFPVGAGQIIKIFSQHAEDLTDANYSSYWAIDNTGKVYAWGYNGNGVLGVGDTTSPHPYPILAGGATWTGKTIVKISASTNTGGGGMAAAIDSNGQLYTWGYNNHYQLGLGNTTQFSSPQPITNLATSTVDVIVRSGYNASNAFSQFVVALKADGSVWGAGSNNSGQLGNGTLTDAQTFTQVTTLPAGTVISKIYGSGAYVGNGINNYYGGDVYLVSNTGTLYVVGSNTYGELGLGDTVNRSSYQTPVGSFQGKVAKVVPLNTWRDQSTGESFILTTDGQLWASGYNGDGSLGLGDTNQRNTYTRVVIPGGANVVDIHGGGVNNSNKFAVITLDDGTMMSTGYDAQGQTGNDTLNTSSSYTFKYVVGFEPGSKQSSVGLGTVVPMNQLAGAMLGGNIDNQNFTQQWNWTTASTSDGLRLAGDNLTSGTLLKLSSASTAFTGSLASLTLSGNSASTTGTVLSLNITGTSASSTALKIGNVGTGLSMDISGMVALRTGFTLTAGGQTNDAVFGNTSLVRLNTLSTPQVITGIAGGTDGAIMTLMNVSPTSTSTLSNDSGSSQVGNRIYTGVIGGGSLSIGPNQSVQLIYDGSTGHWRVVSGSGSGTGSTIIQTLATSSTYALPILQDSNNMTTFGLNFVYKNQIYGLGTSLAYNGSGYSGGGDSANPVLISVAPSTPGTIPTGWSKVVGTLYSACALSSDGRVFCWGSNGQGQLGLGAPGTPDTTDRYQPTFVNLAARGATMPIVDIVMGPSSADNDLWETDTFAIDSAGKVWGWGSNYTGQLGNGTASGDSGANQTYPVQAGAVVLASKQIKKISVSGNTGACGDGTNGCGVRTVRVSVAAIDSTGQLWTWGYNGSGQLGYTNTGNVLVPTAVSGMTNVIDAQMRGQSDDPDGTGGAAGTDRYFMVALKGDGTIWAAGNNTRGQLGTGGGNVATGITQVTTLAASTTKIFAFDGQNGGSTYALVSGTLYATGRNEYGQLGLGDASDRNGFQLVLDAGSQFQGKVAKVVSTANPNAGYGVTYILTTDGEVYSAGYNGNCNLASNVTGCGGNNYSFTKVMRNNNGAKVVDIVIHGYPGNASITQTFIVLDDGTMMAAGIANNNAQLGTSVNNTSYTNNGFDYVLGFGPGQNSALFAGSLVPMNYLTDASSGGVAENSAWTQQWNWSLASTSNALVLSANNLTSGVLESLNTSSTGFSGSLLSLTSSGNATSSNGILANLAIVGTSSAATGLKVSNAGTGLSLDIASGAVAFRKGTDYSTGGTSNNAPFGNSSLIRLTATTSNQVISGIAGGRDGQILTVMNASGATSTLMNMSGLSSAANQIITGTGADLNLSTDQSIMMVYDAGASKWRILSGTGFSLASGATLNQVTVVASSTVSMPQLQDANNGTTESYGGYGFSFIYNGQLYSMGEGSTYDFYGLGNGGAGFNYAAQPTLVSMATSTAVPTGWSQVLSIGDNNGGTHVGSSCALSNVGTVWCWGYNGQGQLGDGTTASRSWAAPVNFPAGATAITKIYSNTSTVNNNNGTFFFAIDTNGHVWGWGANVSGNLGDGTATNRSTPVQVGSGVWGSTVITKLGAGAAGAPAMIALDSTGRVWVWGDNDAGAFGFGGYCVGGGSPCDAYAPILSTTTPGTFVDVQSNTYNNTGGNGGMAGYTLALRNDGVVYAAGYNGQGQLGMGNTNQVNTFTAIPSLSGVVVTKIYAGSGDVAVIDNAGRVYLAGNNQDGQLGNNSTSIANNFFAPQGAFQGKVAKVVLGGDGTGGGYSISIITTDGDLWTAGYNNRGNLGQGSTWTSINQYFQRAVRNSDGAKVVDAKITGYGGTVSQLITLDNGNMMVAGDNTYGQLGFNVLDMNYTSSFKYVLGFGPGDKGSVLSGSMTLPFSVGLSSISGMVSSTTVDNSANTLYMNWSSLTTQIGEVLTANTLTTGSILDISSNSSGLNSQKGLLSIRNLSSSTTGVLASFSASTTNAAGLWIRNNGNVGIGTSTATSLLSLAGITGQDNAVLKISNSVPVQSSWSIWNDNGLGSLNFQNNGLTKMAIASSTGNVGIGTSSPWALLAVNPTASLGTAPMFAIGSSSASTLVVSYKGYLGVGTTSPGALLSVQGTALAQAWNTYSDRALKDNIMSLSASSSLAGILALNPVSYNFKESSTTEFGFIAQDVAGIFPEVVATDTNGIYTMNYQGLIAPAIKAIQELHKMIFGEVASTTVATSTLSDVIASTTMSLDMKVKEMATIIDSVGSTTATSTDEVGNKTFLGRLFDVIANWLSDVKNGITKLYAKEVETQKLCISDESGAKTCLTKAQLDTLIQNAAANASTTSAGGGGGVGTTTPTVTAKLDLVGANPAMIERATPFSDPGALFTGGAGGTETITSTSTVDISTVGTTTLDYWATVPSTGETLHTTRTVVVY